MTKKKVFAFIVLISCIALLIGSYMQWKDKISSVQGESSAPVTGVPTPSEKKDILVKPQLEVERLLTLTAHVDESVQDIFLNRLENEEGVELLIVGSTAMESGEPGYAERLESALKDAYGDFVNVSIEAFDGTSTQFIENMSDEIDFSKGFDVVLFEPFTLTNNGIVVIEDEHSHINSFLERLQSNVEDAVIVLQPPNPIHQASFYPIQVNALQSFAKTKGIPYINHWTKWPDQDSDDILALIDEDNMPNHDGAEVWANALIGYFIAK